MYSTTLSTVHTNQHNPGECYFAGMYWRGITLTAIEAEKLNQYDRDIAKAFSHEARSWLLQNKAEYIGLLLGVETIRII